jgi:hypothetical protein
MKDVTQLYGRLRTLPWPALGKNVGDFALYDTLLAGCADRVARGEPLDVPKVPVPDQGTLSQVKLLRKKAELTQAERAFLEYFDLLEEIRYALDAA